MFTVVVLGGYGNFGAIISKRLAGHPGLNLVVAGRDEHKAMSFAVPLAAQSRMLDGSSPGLANALRELGADVVINCAGPFQNAGYHVARATIVAGAHYIDIADGRRHVCDIATLDSPARKADVAVISGASSVPALSSAVVDAHLDHFARLDTIDSGISASEKIPGVATVAAVLSYAGRTFETTRNGMRCPVVGWQGLHRERFSAPVNGRWQSQCDVPDLELFPQRYKSVRTVSFSAGLGLSATHLGTWLLAGLVRAGMLRQPERYAAGLRKAAVALERFGTGTSAMYVRMSGIDHHGANVIWRWELIARNNDGANIPCLAAVALCRKLASREPVTPGARACVGLLSLQEYLAELDGLDITVSAKRV